MCSLAVGDQQGARYRWSAWAPRQHSTRLHPALAAALAELGWTPAEAARRLAAVAVTTGPGSFTGLRIGIATAMGLSHAWGLPLVGVSTLLILAHAAGPRPGPVAAAIPTPRGECYAALFRPGAAGAPPSRWARCSPDPRRRRLITSGRFCPRAVRPTWSGPVGNQTQPRPIQAGRRATGRKSTNCPPARTSLGRRRWRWPTSLRAESPPAWRAMPGRSFCGRFTCAGPGWAGSPVPSTPPRERLTR